MAPSLRSLYVADLRVVKSKLARYEAGEIAHIENVLRSETRERRHRRLRRTDEFTSVETEREEENTRDVQSTERFELENELNRTATENESFEAGVSTSASGPGFTVTANVGYGRTGSTEESERSAQRSIKELIDKSVARIKERVREVRESRTIVETEESNLHSFINQTDSNISGIYRWVDKYYRMKEVTYGKRLFFEFVIPEPAAFYLMARAHAEQSSTDVGPEPQPPREPISGDPLLPKDINLTNYRYFASVYGSIPVSPPPLATIVTKSISREFTGDDYQSWAFSDSIAIPSGYYAVTGYAVVATTAKGLTRDVRDRVPLGNHPSFGHVIVSSNESADYVDITWTPPREEANHQRVVLDLTNESGEVQISGSGETQGLFIEMLGEGEGTGHAAISDLAWKIHEEQAGADQAVEIV